MSCEPFGLLISKWVDGEAKPEEIRRVEAHIASCPSCRSLAEEFRRNEGLVESAFGPESFGQQVAGGVLGSIARRETLLRWGARLAVAAGLLAAFLVFRADRERERSDFERRVDVALQALTGMQTELASRPSVAPTPVREVVVKWYPVPWPPSGDPGESVAHRPIGPSPDPGVDGLPEEPDRRPGTIAMDRVDAYPDYETGAVALNWRMDRAPGAVFFVYRRGGGEDDFGAPLNDTPLTRPQFEDATGRALETYEYRVVAVVDGFPTVAVPIPRVTIPPDLQVQFLGSGTGEKKSAALVTVHVRRDGAWIEQTFTVEPGSPIGERVKDQDFSTGFRLERVEEALQTCTISDSNKDPEEWQTYKKKVLRAVIRTPNGTVLLWKGAAAAGSHERLEVLELPPAK